MTREELDRLEELRADVLDAERALYDCESLSPREYTVAVERLRQARTVCNAAAMDSLPALLAAARERDEQAAELARLRAELERVNVTLGRDLTEANTNVAVEILSGNVVKEAHARGVCVGLRMALAAPALLAASREAEELREWQREAATILSLTRITKPGEAPYIDDLLTRVKP